MLYVCPCCLEPKDGKSIAVCSGCQTYMCGKCTLCICIPGPTPQDTHRILVVCRDCAPNGEL